MESGTWKGKNGGGVDGLKKIENELKVYTAELPDQTKIIGEAIHEIKWELVKLGFKLSHPLIPDDILEQLEVLGNKIGRNGSNDRNNLLVINHVIKKLYEIAFTKQPEAIDEAQRAIEDELNRLRGALQNGNDNDVINTLKDIRDVGLSEKFWQKHENEKGLRKIEEALTTQLLELAKQPLLIKSGVDIITRELADIRIELSDGDGGNNGIINALNGLKDNGLGEGNWEETDIRGLKQIQDDLKEQNKQLSEASNKIEEAYRSVLSETQTVLKSASKKLRDDLAGDDVLDNLKLLEAKIGKVSPQNGEGLQGIQREISRMQGDAFKSNPEKIEQAKKLIRQELEKLKGNLQDEVTKPLNVLVGQGFGSGDTWNNKKAKGFENIQKHLNTQNDTLTQQPKNIQGGVTIITTELDDIRKVLQGTANDKPENGGVIRNLEFMTTHIGEGENEGLKKIKSDMESLKNDQGKGITDNLDKMISGIQEAAAYAGWHVTQLETPHIDGKLKGIQGGLDKLRFADLPEAIRLCDEFLNKVDEIEKYTVHALLKHVDDEVDDAIKDLTKEARGLYVDSVREALELFAKKVEEDLEQLPSEINRDRYVGYKGFMNTMEGENSGNINRLKCVISKELKLLSAAFDRFFGEVNEYVRQETQRVHDEQNKDKNPSLPQTEEPYTAKLNDVYEALTALLAYLKDNDGGADKLTDLVERLTTALGNLVPFDFKHPSTPLLDTVARGLSKFAGEFGNTYISTYAGQRCREEHAHKYAKVLLSMIPMTYKALNKLAVKCEDNPLGNYLTRCGYRVRSSGSEQDGKLNHMFTGGGIYELLATPIEGVTVNIMVDGEPLENGINLVSIISLLYNTLCYYFQVCHIPVPPESRYPCTVRDMLSWLSGLQYTQVADKLPDHCKALLSRKCHDGDTPNKEDAVMARCIEGLPLTIATTCSRSTALLTAIQGNGHGFDLAAYPYSVDFSNNRAKLHYPNDPVELLEMLREIVYRLCKVLYFLYSQCCRSTARLKGWRECAYGRQVQSHHWQCEQIGTYSSTISTTTATTTSSTTTHGCPPTSPLQSFLSDSCHGLLPHTLSAADMVIECANCVANQPGQQCLTPLGFWDLGFAASISGTGWDLAKRIGDMCRDADSCLFVLCRTLFLLCPTAPSSLADVFALYAQVLRKWDPHDRVNHRGGTYTDASDFISHLNTDGIDSLFPLWTQLHGSYQNVNLTTAIASLAGHDHKSHNALSSLFNDSTCKSPRGCAPYLQPLGLHANHTYPRKHAGLYITWIMYLAWQFWELLNQLLHALENIDCTASGCATCSCQPGIHSDKDTCHCPSLVQCAGPLPTLYRYGFTYRNANLLAIHNRAVRCRDLNAQLKQALHSDHFTELFYQIDQVIWHILMPFFYRFVALWTVVALYIAHTFLYRLDILHIRSHLHTTKSSHRIDVKALLTKGREMLSLYKNVDYFDEDPIDTYGV